MRVRIFAPKTVSKWQSTGHRLHDIYLLLLILLNFHDHIDREENRFFSKGYTAISFQKLRLEQMKKTHNFLWNVHNVPRLCIRQESFLEQVPTDHSRPHDRNHLRAEREG